MIAQEHAIPLCKAHYDAKSFFCLEDLKLTLFLDQLCFALLQSLD